jgi:hypothetical protein
MFKATKIINIGLERYYGVLMPVNLPEIMTHNVLIPSPLLG